MPTRSDGADIMRIIFWCGPVSVYKLDVKSTSLHTYVCFYVYFIYAVGTCIFTTDQKVSLLFCLPFIQLILILYFILSSGVVSRQRTAPPPIFFKEQKKSFCSGDFYISENHYNISPRIISILSIELPRDSW